ncbi:hypothetical protein HQN90_11040 [Paenibacillus alba]|uniref:hypothetical protein n=1 Tax=Paenibacillus alba TaxID=1197127 RepID=UPI00156722E7|nr:hypothetical protein [Paenibacillus alba]NQX66662.1 hypothetical protein [Paenibacillus alba]
MTVGFLLGAGFSKALHPSMPLVWDLLQKIDMPDDVPHSIRGDLEQTLSYLWTNYPWNTEMQHLKNKYEFLRLNQAIYKIISESELDAWNSIYENDYSRVVKVSSEVDNLRWQARLCGLLSNPEKYCLVTMNYDTLLERLMMAYGTNNLIYPAPLQRLSGIWSQETTLDGGEFHNAVFKSWFTWAIRPQLFKLHGSTSWYSLDPLEANAPIYGVDMSQEYLFGSQSTNQEVDNALTSIIVPPVADKSSLYNNKVLRSQWIGASQGLQDCETLYCVGYSFPQSDLPMELFLGQSCMRIKHVVIVDLKRDEDKWNRIKKLFARDVEVEWIVGKDCVEEMALRLIEEESECE